MVLRKITRLFLATSMSLLFAVDSSLAIENLRVAYTSMNASVLFLFIAQPNIKSIAQLRGANIAIMSPEGSLAVVTREILRQNGIDPAKDVNLVVMGGDDVRFRR